MPAKAADPEISRDNDLRLLVMQQFNELLALLHPANGVIDYAAVMAISQQHYQHLVGWLNLLPAGDKAFLTQQLVVFQSNLANKLARWQLDNPDTKKRLVRDLKKFAAELDPPSPG